MQQPTQPPPQTRLTDVAVLVIAALLIVIGAFLFYVGKVDFTQTLSLVGVAGAMLGIKGAFNAPSPTQQAQNNAMFSQMMNVLPCLFAQLPGLFSPPQVTIHNNIPPTATVPATNVLQPINLVTPLAPGTATYMPLTPANTWNQPVAPVPQQAFPTPLKRFDTNTVGVVPGP